MKNWFLYDPRFNDTDFFDTEAEALAASRKIITECRDDGVWFEGVEEIVVGCVTHRATKTNVQCKPPDDQLDDGVDDDGVDWSGIDYCCDYEMQPVGAAATVSPPPEDGR